MDDPIIDVDQFAEQYGTVEIMPSLITSFESMTFDKRMKQMLDGMIEKDWPKAMVGAHTLKGSAGYIYAKRFVAQCKIFQEYIKKDCEKIEGDQTPQDPDKINYALTPAFDDLHKLQAYEYFYPLIQEAISLKREMSKYTNSNPPNDIYSKEIETVRRYHEELKKLVYRKIESQGTIKIDDRQNGRIKTITSQQQLEMKSLQHLEQPQEFKGPILDQPPPKQNCCDKCQIF